MALNRKIAFIHLDSNTVDVKPVDRDWRRKFIGGRGLNAYLLFKYTSAGSGPLGPENTVVVSSGLLSGTLMAPFACAQVAAKVPLTQLMGRAALSGLFAAEMRWAGFDHLVIQGRARHPVYLWVHNGKIELIKASKLWGKGVFESRDMIRQALGDEDVRMISIGPAGENLVHYANITADRNQVSGRTGMGAVFGSKNVKAIVCRGEMDIQIKHPAAALKHQKEFLDQSLSTLANVYAAETFRKDDTPPDDNRSADSDQQCRKPFRPVNRLTADLGLDPLAAESMVRWAARLHKNKVISVKDSGGLRLTPDNPEAARDLIGRIAIRDGFGDILAQGPLQAARKLGAESLKFFSPQHRLISLYTEDIFDAVSHTLTSQLLDRSKRAEQHHGFDQDHLTEKDDPRSAESGHRMAVPVETREDPFTGSAGKVFRQDLYEMASHCLGFCMGQNLRPFGAVAGFSLLKELIGLNTGWAISEKDLQDSAYRCCAVERLFNLRESASGRQKQGRDQKFEIPVDLAMAKKLLTNVDLDKLRQQVNAYYRLDGWDKATVLKLKIFKALELSDLWPLAKPKGGS